MNTKDLFQPIQWPEVQELFEVDGFRNNSILINNSPLYDEYGDSSYLVRVSWLESLE